MGKYEAVLMSFSGNKEDDPSRHDFNSIEEAEIYVINHRCKLCREMFRSDSLNATCDYEWEVDEVK